jgi:hypothetical protein
MEETRSSATNSLEQGLLGFPSAIGRSQRELLYSTLIGANPAPHTPMVTGPGPLDCFRAFFSGTFTPWLVVGLAHFAFVRFFAFSSLFVFLLFLFHISYFDCFLKFLNRNKLKIGSKFKLEQISKAQQILNREFF